MADDRFQFFKALQAIEKTHGITFFALVYTPDLYVYHKKDSIEFSMALKGQSVSAMSASVSKLQRDITPGKLVVHKILKYHHQWWKTIKAQMERLSREKNWLWFLIAFDGTRAQFTAESTATLLTEDSRARLFEAVDVMWKESSRADIEYAKDSFVNRALETARHSADREFFDRKGIRRI